ncbi:MAG: glycohydrolase [Hoeflea sp.]|nr:glycohydrolase [Hoeflea sp.]|tara:strand:- start:27191 stop:28024 length:834 start_codon:yes stop_codon:yes gene_type:complete
MLSPSLLRHLYPAASEEMLQAFAEGSGEILPRFGISERRDRLHFFLAQIGHESGGLRITSENMNYSAKRIRQVWPKRFNTIADAEPYAHNPEKLANKVYGGRMGNDQPGDGWAYRGRGLIQITGKEGYREVGKRAHLDLVKQPDLASDPRYALTVACAFWTWKNLNKLCDGGDFVLVTKRINGGTVGLKDRFEWLAKVQSLVAWPPAARVVSDVELSLPVARIKAVQLRLREMGLYAGSIDGIFGKLSRAGLRAYQSQEGLPITGRITQAVLDRLSA